ncbi:MAG: phosphoenolpyruvate carboxylase, partial [Phototrophicales bacterium]
MSSLLQSSSQTETLFTDQLMLQMRLKLVEEIWESVLVSECGQELFDLLVKMRSLSSPEGTTEQPTPAVTQLVEDLSIDDSLRAARAFALYFQLINIVEQHYEQRQQQLSQTINYQTQQHQNGNDASAKTSPVPGAAQLETNWQQNHPDQNTGGTFDWLFPHLKQVNMPPKMIQELLLQLDVRLV